MKKLGLLTIALLSVPGTVIATCDWKIDFNDDCPTNGETVNCDNGIDPNNEEDSCDASGGVRVVGGPYTVDHCVEVVGAGYLDWCLNVASPPQPCYHFNKCDVMSAIPCNGAPGKVLCVTSGQPQLALKNLRSPEYEPCP